ncbi:hypothetical protein FD754_023644, partial [Muntiacus muntjak]
MSGKPILHYFNGRGRMECIRWLLAAAGVEFEEKFIEKPEDLDKLKNDGSLLFQQVPMVEIDGMNLVQTRAILNYIATKYNLYGKDIKERALIDMYSEGVADLGEMIMLLPLCPAAEKDAKVTLIREKTTNRFLPAFENSCSTSFPQVIIFQPNFYLLKPNLVFSTQWNFMVILRAWMMEALRATLEPG